MTTYRASLAATALAIAAAFGSLPASAQPVQFFAIMEGAYETAAADTDGHGVASFLLNGNQICFSLLARNITAPTAAHIHRGRAGVSGPVVVTLTAPALTSGVARSVGCVAASGGIIRAIRLTPSGFYVNVHNAAFPDGAIRGQLF
jgi:hypothetical protein